MKTKEIGPRDKNAFLAPILDPNPNPPPSFYSENLESPECDSVIDFLQSIHQKAIVCSTTHLKFGDILINSENNGRRNR